MISAKIQRLPGYVLGVAALATFAVSAAAAGQAVGPQATAQAPPAAAAATTAQGTRRARQAYQEGLRAEQANDWERAFQAYQEAASEDSRDTAIRVREEFARFQLVQEHTERAERDILSGSSDGARGELQAALALDPGYSVARERLAQLVAPAAATAAAQTPGGAATVATRAGTHDFDYQGTTRGAYEEIARQFGVTAAFDEELVDRQIRFRVTGADFETALRVLSEQTTTFWRGIDRQTFFVAADTPAKRRDYAPEVQRAILLPDSETPDEMTETTRVVRDIVGLQRTELNAGTHTLTVRDTPQNVALAVALVNEIEHAPGEVMLDIDVLEVDRNVAQQIGISPPTAAQMFSLNSGVIRQLQQAVNNGTLVEVLQSIFGGQNPLASVAGGASALIPPLIAFGGGKTLFLATLPGASADFSRSLSLVRHAQRVLLRAEDGRPATLFVGERFPITLALLSASLSVPSSLFAAGIPAGAFPRSDFAVGNQPSGVALGDFNGDGKLDAAVVDTTDNTVSILLGNGDGTFAAATTFATGTGPVAVATGAFTSSGHLDLAVANETDNTVSILLGNGDGTFVAHTDVAVGAKPVALLSGQFNTTNNGNFGLAVVNQTDNTVSILTGNGDGTFAAKHDFAVGTTPSAIVSGDFNADGKPDLAATNSAANSVSVLLGAGDGTFSKLPNDLATGGDPLGIATADFNADSRPDLAVANFADNSISLFTGNGDGTFGNAGAIATGTGPAAILAADFNSDGLPDLVTADQAANTVSVFLGLGNAQFASPIDIATGNAPVALAAADLNGDLLPDLAIANQSSNSISAILNESSISSLLNAPPLSSYPGSEYVDLGLKVHAVPRIHPNGEVTLNLEFDISSLAGQNVNGIPILSNRTISQTVRLRENETSVLSGIMESSNLRSSSGWPGIGQIPVLNDILSSRSKQVADTELLIAITPRQLRSAPRTDRTFYAGRGAGAAAPAANQPPPPGPPPPGVPPGNQPPGNVPPNANPPAQAPEQAPPPGAGAARPDQAPPQPTQPPGPQN